MLRSCSFAGQETGTPRGCCAHTELQQTSRRGVGRSVGPAIAEDGDFAPAAAVFYAASDLNPLFSVWAARPARQT